MSNLKETAWDYIAGDTTATFCTGEKKWLNKLRKWIEKYPAEVEIQNINPDGSMVVTLPVSWCKVAPKRQSNMTPEQKELAKQRMAEARRNIGKGK